MGEYCIPMEMPTKSDEALCGPPHASRACRGQVQVAQPHATVPELPAADLTMMIWTMLRLIHACTQAQLTGCAISMTRWTCCVLECRVLTVAVDLLHSASLARDFAANKQRRLDT